MASYLLLRNNTKSGPFSLDDLLKCGLKPYDLVWVDGKSAAWRYPSEIAELKPYAPAVEEQPFDRFFKKNTEAQAETVAVTPKIAGQVKEKPAQQEIPAIEAKYEKYIPKKSVFVTMPGQASSGSASANSGQIQKPQTYQPEPAPDPVPTITVTENPEAARIKFSQPLDEIKEMYVKTLQQRKSKIARKNFLLANLKRAAVILGLIALGIFAGLAINSDSGDDDTLAQQTIQKSVPATVALPGLPATVTDETVLQEQNTTHSPALQNAASDPLPPQVKQRLLEQEQKELTTSSRLKKETPLVSPAEQHQFEEEPQSVEKDPSTGERSRKLRSDSPEDQPAAKNIMPSRKTGLANLVSVTSNEYKRVAFGGIRNLELTVTNDSKYVLDKVTVELNYLKPSEEPLKTELIQFHSVSPNGSMTIKVKDTNRGIKVSYKIVDIKAQQTETALRE